jgi:hypothetical protein
VTLRPAALEARLRRLKDVARRLRRYRDVTVALEKAPEQFDRFASEVHAWLARRG